MALPLTAAFHFDHTSENQIAGQLPVLSGYPSLDGGGRKKKRSRSKKTKTKTRTKTSKKSRKGRKGRGKKKTVRRKRSRSFKRISRLYTNYTYESEDYRNRYPFPFFLF